MRRPVRVGLAIGLGLLAPPAALAVAGPAWAVVVTFALGTLSLLAPLGVAAGWFPLSLHDPAMVVVAVVWLGSVLVGGGLAHVRTPPAGRSGWAVPVLVAIAYLVVVRGPASLTDRVVHRYDVHGISMQPTLRAGEDLLVRRRTSGIEPGDVVLYDPDPAHTALPWIKRVVAVAGQRVAIRDGALFVDGEPAAVGPIRTERLSIDAECAHAGPVDLRDERFGSRTVAIRVAPGELADQTVPDGHIFVLGDNRPASLDSRRHGPVPIARVRGVVLGVVLPWSRCGLDLKRLGRVP